jgi:Predicted membrane protein (DUF2142)
MSRSRTKGPSRTKTSSSTQSQSNAKASGNVKGSSNAKRSGNAKGSSKAKGSSNTRAASTSPRRPPSKARNVGTRAFVRQAQDARRRDTRKQVRTMQPKVWPSPREMLRRVPRAAWICALIGCLSAMAWSIITPPFQVVDEPEHVAYVNQLATTGRLPTKHFDEFSAEETLALQGTQLQKVAEEPENHTISSRVEQRQLDQDLHAAEESTDTSSEGAGVATSEPPLYYALQAIPYSIAGGTLLDRIAVMRLFSALFAGLTALFTFLFLRELLPRVPWAWAVGGVGVALVPLLGYMSGAVNPESMLCAVTAALFFGLARGFRLGLTRRHALALGAVIAVGLLTKLNFVGIAPGAMLGLVILSVRAARTLGRAAYISLAMALSLALSPALLDIMIQLASGNAALPLISGGLGTIHWFPSKELSYIWEFYIPHLPGMHNYFAGVSTPLLWFRGYVGLYGWLDTTFPGWVYEAALLIAIAILALCLRSLFGSRALLRGRLLELLVYCLMAVGLLALIAASSYLALPRSDGEFIQSRYLLPLLPLLGGVIALAARGGGRRWGPVVGASIIMLFLAHDIFSQLQEVARYYG